MKSLRLPHVALACLLAACTPAPGVKPAASSKPVAASPTPAAHASMAPAGVARLVKPAGAVTTLTGTVALDPAYAAAAGTKTLSSGALAARGSVISNDGASLIGQDGASIATADGANLVARGQGSLITNDGGSLITNDGGGLITNDGGSLITNDGGSIISNDGAGIVAQGGGNYGLLDAPAGAAPAAGYWVALYSLSTGKLLPVGEDERGKQVYAVFSNLKGGFTLYVPPDEADNVLVLAADPRAKDRRLAVSRLTPKAAAAGTVDEGSTSAVAYLRASLAPRLQEALDSNLDLGQQIKDPIVATLVGARPDAVGTLKQALAGAYAKLSYPRKQRVWQALADGLIARGQLDQIQIDPTIGTKDGASGPALAEVSRILEGIRLKASERLAADPKAFDQTVFMKVANARRPGGVPYKLLKGSDLVDLVVGAFLSTSDDDVNHLLDDVLADLGLPRTDRRKLHAAGASIFLAQCAPLFTDDAVLAARKAGMEAAIALQAAAQQPDEPKAPPAPPAAPAPQTSVTTLAGGSAGFKDGPGASAAFKEPAALAAGPDGTLYVCDSDNDAIRKVAPDGTVTTLVGVPGVPRHGYQDGSGQAVLMHGPEGIAFDGQDTLYVSDTANHCIRKLTHLAGPVQVSTYAGKGGEAGFKDGAAADARFNKPFGLAIGPDGTLYVADHDNDRLRAISPAGQVTTAGGGVFVPDVQDPWAKIHGLARATDGTLYFSNALDAILRNTAQGVLYTYAGMSTGFVDSTFPTARFHTPIDLAVDAKANLFVADRDNHAIRKVYPAGFVVTLAGGPAAGFKDGGKDAQFNQPCGVAAGPAGTVYVADRLNHRIRKLVVTGD